VTLTAPPLLAVDRVTIDYRRGWRLPPVRAIDQVSLAIAPGETLGLVGESGSGKTTLGRAILGRAPIQDGTIRFAGHDITRASRDERRSLSKELQVVFQDPTAH
jgi:ABC-type oligopeptide transport system ATPase subunit